MPKAYINENPGNPVDISGALASIMPMFSMFLTMFMQFYMLKFLFSMLKDILTALR